MLLQFLLSMFLVPIPESGVSLNRHEEAYTPTPELELHYLKLSTFTKRLEINVY